MAHCGYHPDLTQEEIAQLVGASRETVNKALADFICGWIRLGVLISDSERLARPSRWRAPRGVSERAGFSAPGRHESRKRRILARCAAARAPSPPDSPKLCLHRPFGRIPKHRQRRGERVLDLADRGVVTGSATRRVSAQTFVPVQRRYPDAIASRSSSPARAPARSAGPGHAPSRCSDSKVVGWAAVFPCR